MPEEVKQDRLDQLMRLQQTISLEKNQSYIDQTLDVLIESHAEVEDSDEPIAVGRSYRDAPEIDGLVFVESHPVKRTLPKVGSIVPVHISGALTYDLSGMVDES